MQYTKIFIITLVFLLSNLCINQTFAQYNSQNVLKANILGAPIGGFSISYERAYTDNKSALITGRFMFYDFSDTQVFNFGTLGDVSVDYGVDFTLIGVLPEARFHLYSF